MKMIPRRSRFQAGCLTTERRSNGIDVYIYRWREAVGHDGTRQKKLVLGTVKELSKTQAQRKADALRREVSEPVPAQTNSDLSVAGLVEHYQKRELGMGSGKSAKFIKTYEYILAAYIVPKWGASPLHAVKAIAIEDWLRSMEKANGTKAKIREVFGAAFRHAMRYELHPTNPIAHVRQVRRRSVEPSVLEPSEIVAILDELGGLEPVRTAFLIAAVTGMRRGEIFGLKWADVDIARSAVHVRRSYVDGVEGPPKTESSRRPLPIPAQALSALETWKRRSTFSSSNDWIFASEFHFGRQPLWPGTLWRRNVAPAILRAGINKPKLGWHTLRRSYASLLLSEGASLRVSMELMRHSSPEMTLATYAQTVGTEKRDASSKVASLLFPQP